MHRLINQIASVAPATFTLESIDPASSGGHGNGTVSIEFDADSQIQGCVYEERVINAPLYPPL